MSKNNLDTDVLKVAMYLRLSQDDEKIENEKYRISIPLIAS